MFQATLIRMGLILLFLGANTRANASEFPTPQTVKVGMLRGMFHDLPSSLVQSLSKPFRSLMHSSTGFHGQVAVCTSPDTLAQRLNQGEVHIGVFHGFEFAWMQKKYPELRPLVLAVPFAKKLRAYIVVRKDSSLKHPEELTDCVVAMARGHKAHCRLFLNCQVDPDDQAPEFRQIIHPSCCQDALDEVINGTAVATVVDESVLLAFGELKPGRYNQLKVLARSDRFPLSVIAYRRNGLDHLTLDRLRRGLIEAHRTSQGRSMMMLWNLRGFSSVPDSYAKELEQSLKRYPMVP